MRVAVPMVNGVLSAHFGHCEEFAIIDVDPEGKAICKYDRVPAPPHAPGLLPRWLSERKVNLVIAGGMGMRAQELFTDESIDVVVGAPPRDPETLVKAYLGGSLETGANTCDH